VLRKLFYLLFFLIFCFGCSTRVEKKSGAISKEQVDVAKFSPLAQFILKEDSLNLFESFTEFEVANSKQNSNLPLKKNNQLNLLYYVHVGLTDVYDEIVNLRSQITNLLPDEKISIEYDTPFYRLKIGPYASRSEANEIFSILERKNFPSLRIRTENPK
jgi:pyruvate-formate lyase-activating enzyme